MLRRDILIAESLPYGRSITARYLCVKLGDLIIMAGTEASPDMRMHNSEGRHIENAVTGLRLLLVIFIH
jgi:hypothetical protein